jgi:hypothetical protein
MKVFKYSVDVFVHAETEEEGMDTLVDEMEYVCSLDNSLAGVAYPDNGDFVEDLG